MADSTKKKIYQKIVISDKHWGYTDAALSSFKDFDKSIQISGCLEINLPKVTKADVADINVTYRELICNVEEMDISLFKHLIGPSVQKCKIDLYIPDKKLTGKQNSDFLEFLKSLLPLLAVQLTIYCNEALHSYIDQKASNFESVFMDYYYRRFPGKKLGHNLKVEVINKNPSNYCNIM